jgi:hypothetical protein
LPGGHVKEGLKNATKQTLEAELKEAQETLKRSELALTRTMASSERDQIRVSIRLNEAKILDLKKQIARAKE